MKNRKKGTGHSTSSTGPLQRHKVAQQMPTQPGDDARPVVGVGGELVFLERDDFVADEAGDGHGDFSCGDERSLGVEGLQCFGAWRNGAVGTPLSWIDRSCESTHEGH